jgi:uncharacterized YigZ family protein
MPPYRIPAHAATAELTIAHSRFIAQVRLAGSAADARATLAGIRAAAPDATHHVYAFRAGYGNSVTEGMSDDGEPSGTAGPPLLAVLRGAAVGDTLLVVTRYFGGTKLGTGGLVRAYTSAAQLGLAATTFEHKIERHTLTLHIPYATYEPLTVLIRNHDGQIDTETFAAEVTLTLTLPAAQVAAFAAAAARYRVFM